MIAFTEREKLDVPGKNKRNPHMVSLEFKPERKWREASDHATALLLLP